MATGIQFPVVVSPFSAEIMALLTREDWQAALGLTLPAPGILSYTHNQTIPDSTWNVAHNLGYRPTACTLWIDDVLRGAVVEHVDDNNLVVRFNANRTGVFKCL